MIRYEFRAIDEATADRLIFLSKLWVAENCSHGIVENSREDLQEPLAVALDGDTIVGYVFGHFYTPEKKRSYIQPGSKCFCVDELYVLPEYRSGGIGQKLFRMMEKHVRDKCDYITLSTATKDYKSILKLYVDILGMDFHSAFLTKNIKENNGEEPLCE